MDNLIHKNEEYVVRIAGMGYEGEGVGRINGFTVFVPGAIVDETVKIKTVKVNKKFAFGKLLEVVKTSPEREEPLCSIYNRCGGCQLQHMSYKSQLDFKKNRVNDCLQRIGKLQQLDKILHDTIGMKEPHRYRNKSQLPVGKNRGKLSIGFYARRSHDIIDMKSCIIQNEDSDKVAMVIRQWISEYNIEPYDEKENAGIIKHIMVRKAFATGEIMVVIITHTLEFPHKSELIKLLTDKISGIKSIIQNFNPRKTNVIMGEKCITLWGKDVIEDYIGKFKFTISPLSFFQVNPVQTEILYNKALEYAGLTGSETVFDAYCGTGTISLFLSQRAKKVYGVEIVKQAVENARDNARDNGIENVEFIVGKSEEVIPELIDKGIKADVIVVDPPRKGCEKALLDSISKMMPQRIVYVSCDPGTLARDIGILGEFGYKTVEIQPVDMFPQTGHVETVVMLTRIEKMM